MKIFRSDIPIELTILLVILTIFFAIFFAIPFLLVVGFIWIVRRIIAGPSPLERYLREDPRTKSQTDDDTPNPGNMASGSGDETIECEVISARTLDENGQEIR